MFLSRMDQSPCKLYLTSFRDVRTIGIDEIILGIFFAQGKNNVCRTTNVADNG